MTNRGKKRWSWRSSEPPARFVSIGLQKTEGAAGLDALATVQAQQEVSIDEGVVRTRTRLAYEISRAELSQLVVEVPLDQKVTRVTDPNVKKWEVAKDDSKQTITIDLFQAARGTQNITVDCEKFSDEAALRDTQIPVVQAVNVGRQQGVVVVRLGDELRAEATAKNGLFQLDAAELPQPLQNVNWAFAYRYAALPFDLAMSVEKVKPRIRVQQLVEAYPRAGTHHARFLRNPRYPTSRCFPIGV